MIRILSPQISVAPESNMGGTVFDRELLAAMAALGARIDLVLPHGETAAQIPGWQVVRASAHRRYTFEYNLRYLPAVERLWRSHPFDIYRVHSPSIAPLGLWMQRRTGRPLVAHYHHVEPDQPVHNRISQVALPRYNLITVDSAFVLGQLETFGFERSRAVVTYPGVSS
ncbi:MAG: glycosyltransferase, partial [Caldilineaceae bacterium]